MFDATGIRILFGLPHNEGKRLLNSIAERRFKRIRSNLTRKTDEYLYGGSRCCPVNIADRFSGYAFRKGIWHHYQWQGLRGNLRYVWACLSTWIGWQDVKIEKIWHERAGAEYYYTYEKDWS